MTSVLYVHTRFDSPGGANYVAVETANRLVQRDDLAISIATARFNHDIYDLCDDVQLYEFGGGSPSTLGHWIQLPHILHSLSSIIDTKEVDIVVFHSIPTPYWTVVLERLAPEITYAWFAHDPNAYLNLPGKIEDIPNPLRTFVQVFLPGIRHFDRHIVRKHVDTILSNSEFTKQIITDAYDVHSTVIYPGVRTDYFSGYSETLNQSFFTVGQLNRYNNFDVLIRSMGILTDRLENPPSLIIGGEGQNREYLEDLVWQEGLTDFVTFVGYLSDQELREQYARSLATVYLPENEPFGLVPVESMASGTPVVAIDSGGIRETIIDEKTGKLVSSVSEEAIANALVEIATDTEYRESLENSAQKRARKLFSAPEMANRFEDILRRES